MDQKVDQKAIKKTMKFRLRKKCHRDPQKEQKHPNEELPASARDRRGGYPPICGINPSLPDSCFTADPQNVKNVTKNRYEKHVKTIIKTVSTMIKKCLQNDTTKHNKTPQHTTLHNTISHDTTPHNIAQHNTTRHENNEKQGKHTKTRNPFPLGFSY
jgi:hypothetical protein